jgi:AcrR family transcriptional regulator
MRRQHRASSTPERILAAAARVVWRDSVRRLTLEAVAREAHLSKGGVLDHFATKEALIQALLARLLQSCERDPEGPPQDAEPGRWTRASVRRQCAPVWPSPGDADLPHAREAGAGFLLAATTHPRGLEPLRARFQAWQQAIERDGIDPVWATVVRLAADGFWLATLLGLWSPSRPLQQHVLHELIRLTRETPQRCRARTP